MPYLTESDCLTVASTFCASLFVEISIVPVLVSLGSPDLASVECLSTAWFLVFMTTFDRSMDAFLAEVSWLPSVWTWSVVSSICLLSETYFLSVVSLP